MLEKLVGGEKYREKQLVCWGWNTLPEMVIMEAMGKVISSSATYAFYPG